MGRLTLVSDEVTVDIDMVKRMLMELPLLTELLQDINDDYDAAHEVKVSNLPPDEKIVEIECGCIVLITDEDYEAPDPENDYLGAMFGKVISRCPNYDDERGEDTPDTLVVYRDRIVNEEASV